MKHKKTFIISVIVLTLFMVSGSFIMLHFKVQMKDLFRMNKELQQEGYYMGDFEFKMLGFAYWIDKGHYIKGISGINQLHEQMESREGLVRFPAFKNKEEEMEFYLNLQNPKTGAFMDDDYPYCTYNDPTENVLLHLKALAKETGNPLNLKYPLKYLDDINTPETLTAFLDDISHIGWIASNFPQTSFVFARGMLGYYSEGESAIGENNLYEFSPEWKETLIQWFYDNQDPKTGFWGPMSKNSKTLLIKDLTNTSSIVKAFVDENGNDIYEDFPLRYKVEMFKTAIEVLSEPMPEDSSLDEVHEWHLKMTKGIYMLLRYLWKDALQEDKDEAKKIMENHIKILFEKNYVPDDSAFSYYPNEKHASLDGMGNFFLFKDFGAFSEDKQEKLWGNQEEYITDLGTREFFEFSENDFDLFANSNDVNSIRVYIAPSNKNYHKNVEMVFYAKETLVLDIMDLTPKVKYWTETTPHTLGNWVSKETVLQNLESINVEKVPVYNGVPLKELNNLLQNNKEITAIGFDVLQIPRYKMTFKFGKINLP